MRFVRHEAGAFVRIGRHVWSVTNHAAQPPLFSERFSGQHGISRHLFVHVGPWCLTHHRDRLRRHHA